MDPKGDVVLAKASTGELEEFGFPRANLIPMYSKLCTIASNMVLVCLEPTSETYVKTFFDGEVFKIAETCECYNCLSISPRDILTNELNCLSHGGQVDEQKKPIICIHLAWNQEKTIGQPDYFVNHEGVIGKYEKSETDKCWNLINHLEHVALREMIVPMRVPEKWPVIKTCSHLRHLIYNPKEDEPSEQFSSDQSDPGVMHIKCEQCENLDQQLKMDGTVDWQEVSLQKVVSGVMDELRKNPQSRRKDIFIDESRCSSLTFHLEEQLGEDTIYWLKDSELDDICPFKIEMSSDSQKFGKLYAMDIEELLETRLDYYSKKMEESALSKYSHQQGDRPLRMETLLPRREMNIIDRNIQEMTNEMAYFNMLLKERIDENQMIEKEEEVDEVDYEDEEEEDEEEEDEEEEEEEEDNSFRNVLRELDDLKLIQPKSENELQNRLNITLVPDLLPFSEPLSEAQTRELQAIRKRLGESVSWIMENGVEMSVKTKAPRMSAEVHEELCRMKRELGLDSSADEMDSDSDITSEDDEDDVIEEVA